MGCNGQSAPDRVVALWVPSEDPVHFLQRVLPCGGARYYCRGPTGVCMAAPTFHAGQRDHGVFFCTDRLRFGGGLSLLLCFLAKLFIATLPHVHITVQTRVLSETFLASALASGIAHRRRVFLCVRARVCGGSFIIFRGLRCLFLFASSALHHSLGHVTADDKLQFYLVRYQLRKYE